MSSDRPSILITGANGFIGSRLCLKFSKLNFDVVAGVRATADLKLLDGINVTCRYGDITDPNSLAAMVAGVDYVIHNAGLVKARTEQRFFEVNEGGTKNLFEAIERHNRTVNKVVYVSSLAVAGPVIHDRPVTESDPANPVTAYGRSKSAGERVAISFCDRMHVVSVRPPAVYGPGDKEMFTLFQTVHYRLKPHIGNVDRKLQLVHVDDLCEGIYRAVVSETESGSIYFIAENKSYSMKDMMMMLEQACGRKAMPLRIPAPIFTSIATVAELFMKMMGQVPMLTREKSRELLASWEVDTRRATEELEFTSRIPFAEGARDTYAWYREKGWL